MSIIVHCVRIANSSQIISLAYDGAFFSVEQAEQSARKLGFTVLYSVTRSHATA